MRSAMRRKSELRSSTCDFIMTFLFNNNNTSVAKVSLESHFLHAKTLCDLVKCFLISPEIKFGAYAKYAVNCNLLQVMSEVVKEC